MYSQIEMCWIFVSCENATELITCREILEQTGNHIGAIAFYVYNVLMKNLLIAEKI